MNRTQKLQLVYLLNSYKVENLNTLELAMKMKAEESFQVLIENHLRTIESLISMLNCEIHEEL
ncbi:hypothetical protein KQI85_02045 [Falcatimonas sp. MSJ-15]|uniref:hypothetical protein n=1 Tax=Falcatimonas sp. MSJ-15 TaxID=2841515 RepID=UPI001C10DFB0|nr:hypothetical protein [Falcatimonas sp. MSJ-15]MBU5469156.1 hypothetical protein [Falcatimonas sp. MSJ-15]